jgi:hypothetical protein
MHTHEEKAMPVFESKRKVQTFGSSYAMTLPMLFVKGNEIKKGLECNIIFGFNGVLLVSVTQDPRKITAGLEEISKKIEKNEVNSK